MPILHALDREGAVHPVPSSSTCLSQEVGLLSLTVPSKYCTCSTRSSHPGDSLSMRKAVGYFRTAYHVPSHTWERDWTRSRAAANPCGGGWDGMGKGEKEGGRGGCSAVRQMYVQECGHLYL